jgi:hypothetical protein
MKEGKLSPDQKKFLYYIIYNNQADKEAVDGLPINNGDEGRLSAARHKVDPLIMLFATAFGLSNQLSDDQVRQDMIEVVRRRIS